MPAKKQTLSAPSYLSPEEKKCFDGLKADFDEILLPRHSHALAQLAKTMLLQKRVQADLAALKELIAESPNGQLQIHPLWNANKEVNKQILEWMSVLCINPISEKKRAHDVKEEEEENPYADIHKRNKERRERSKS